MTVTKTNAEVVAFTTKTDAVKRLIKSSDWDEDDTFVWTSDDLDHYRKIMDGYRAQAAQLKKAVTAALDSDHFEALCDDVETATGVESDTTNGILHAALDEAAGRAEAWGEIYSAAIYLLTWS